LVEPDLDALRADMDNKWAGATERLERLEARSSAVARRLAEENQISPLATRGIIGQVTSSFLVYDAETTSGGSGGPVLDMDGRVVAVNTAILSEFGGSNLGVPANRALALVERARGG
jgi:S1-C subfamily serine protease